MALQYSVENPSSLILLGSGQYQPRPKFFANIFAKSEVLFPGLAPDRQRMH